MKLKQTVGIFLIAGIGGVSSLGISKFFDQEQAQGYTIAAPAPVKYINMPGASLAEVPDFAAAAEMSVNSVVHVKTVYERAEEVQMADPLYRFFYGPNAPKGGNSIPQMASGSGVIISNDGYIVTNNHVIEDADKVEVTLNNKSTYEAKVIGTDPNTDLALLKVDEKNLPFASYGNSDEVRVGEWVLAVGNPFNLTSTVTAGIVSAKGRSIHILGNDPAKGQFPIESFIQTDAAVNPGNSGGALVNTRGELVGINTAIASQTGSYSGYSFAIPVNMVQKVVRDLIEYGEVQRAFLGVSIRDIDYKLVKEKELKEARGVYISDLTDNGAAIDAGLKSGDVILKVGGINVNSVPELQEQVARYRPGDKIAVTVKRQDEEKLVAVVLKNREGTTGIVKKPEINREVLNALGASLEPVSNEEKAKLKIDGGVKVKGLSKGKLQSAGVKEGFIITKVDKTNIKRPEELSTALENKKGGVLIEGVYPNGMRAYYGLGI